MLILKLNTFKSCSFCSLFDTFKIKVDCNLSSSNRRFVTISVFAVVLPLKLKLIQPLDFFFKISISLIHVTNFTSNKILPLSLRSCSDCFQSDLYRSRAVICCYLSGDFILYQLYIV